ncbi:MAG: hypothetical protein LAT80_11925, partial [Balneolaceae bacterium]|nr:hypothetical protein [Balneolaceae bacterium]
MKKENVWYYKMGSTLEKSTINYFKKKGYWGKVIWHEAEFNHDRYGDKEVAESYKNHFYREVPEEIYNHVYKHLFTYIDMYFRMAPKGGFIYDHKNIYDYVNLFNRDLNFIYHMLVLNKINLVIFPRSPHLGGDLILYLLAEKMGLKTLILEHSKLTNKFFFYYNVKDYGEFKTSKKITEYEKVEIENKFEKDLHYMNEFYKKNKKSVRKILRDVFRPEYRLILEIFQSGGIEQSLNRYKKRRQFKKDLKSVIEENIDLNKNFIYFPLHLQPEKTTSA